MARSNSFCFPEALFSGALTLKRDSPSVGSALAREDIGGNVNGTESESLRAMIFSLLSDTSPAPAPGYSRNGNTSSSVSAPASNITNRSTPSAIPPDGGMPARNAAR